MQGTMDDWLDTLLYTLNRSSAMKGSVTLKAGALPIGMVRYCASCCYLVSGMGVAEYFQSCTCTCDTLYFRFSFQAAGFSPEYFEGIHMLGGRNRPEVAKMTSNHV